MSGRTPHKKPQPRVARRIPFALYCQPCRFLFACNSAIFDPTTLMADCRPGNQPLGLSDRILLNCKRRGNDMVGNRGRRVFAGPLAAAAFCAVFSLTFTPSKAQENAPIRIGVIAEAQAVAG